MGSESSADIRRPISESLQKRTQMERAASPLKHVVLRPACPPVGWMPAIVRDRIKSTPVAVRPHKVDFQGPAGIIDGADRRTKPMLPNTIALGFIPAGQPIQNVHPVKLAKRQRHGKKAYAFEDGEGYYRQGCRIHRVVWGWVEVACGRLIFPPTASANRISNKPIIAMTRANMRMSVTGLIRNLCRRNKQTTNPMPAGITAINSIASTSGI